jgi:hypothetical protein
MNILKTATVTSVFFFASQALAQMAANTSVVAPAGRTLAGGGLVFSTVDYDVEGGLDPSIERKTLFGEFGYGMTPVLDVFGQAGLIFESEFDDSDVDGSGFMFGAGTRFVIHNERPLRVNGYGLLNMTFEDFKEGSVKCKSNITDLHGGVTTSFAATPTIAPYGGIDLAVHSDGKVKCKASSVSSSSDIERDDLLSIRLGATFDFSNMYLRPEAIVAGESTIILALGTRL